MNLKALLFVFLIGLITNCTLPKQPILTIKEKVLIENLGLKCHCRVERFYSSSYLRYGQPGEYTVTFNGVDMRSTIKYINDSGFVIAKFIFNDLLNSDRNVTSINFMIIDSIGNNTFKNAYFDYRVDSMLITN